jgi:dienelactone hydrolase
MRAIVQVCLVAVLAAVLPAHVVAAESVTIAYQADGKPVELGGALYRPSGDGPFPAAVLMHGCSGVEKNHDAWARKLAERGYMALIVEGFRSRGVADVCTERTFNKVSYAARVADAYAGAAFLRARADVDGDRVSVIGWSHGGIIALKLATKQPATLSWADVPIVPFRGIVAFYPYCGAAKDTVLPLLILIGTEDDWTPAANCVGYEKMQKAIGAPIELVLYEGATHSFDEASVGQGYVYAGHFLRYDGGATADATERLFAFLTRTLGD